MKRLYIIAGPNGAGKTTASYTILPEILNCKEFVNADEIAKGISPFNSGNVGIQAGRLMLNRIKELLNQGETFAFETTLSSKSFISVIKEARTKDYEVVLLFLMLDTVKLAIERVATRVKEGGHSIPKEVIVRRYNNGMRNFFNLYINIVDKWFFVNNSGDYFQFIAEGGANEVIVKDENIWYKIKQRYYGN